MTRRHFLMDSAAGLTSLAFAGNGKQSQSNSAKAVIVLWMDGGPSQLETFDPKPAAPASIRGALGTRPTSVPGLYIGELLPRMAGIMHRVALVRSISHDETSHDRACRAILTARVRSSDVPPSLGSLLAYQAKENLTPAYFALPGRSSACGYLGSGCLPPRYGPATRADAFDHRPGFEVFSKALTLEREPLRVREVYGNHGFGRDCLAARRLVEQGVRFVLVSYGGWDHHAEIGDACRRIVPILDQGMSALISDLDRKGLIDETLVVWMGEFGRTPKINALGGRDHQPQAGCALFAGAGVPGGCVVGETDRIGGEPAGWATRPSSIAATIFAKLGVCSSTNVLQFENAHDIPRGEPIRELM